MAIFSHFLIFNYSLTNKSGALHILILFSCRPYEWVTILERGGSRRITSLFPYCYIRSISVGIYDETHHYCCTWIYWLSIDHLNNDSPSAGHRQTSLVGWTTPDKHSNNHTPLRSTEYFCQSACFNVFYSPRHIIFTIFQMEFRDLRCSS